MKTPKYKFNAFQSAWLKALESGKYKQATHSLCAVNVSNKLSYCCLGVACEVWNNKIVPKHHKRKLTKEPSTNGSLVNFSSFKYDGERTGLPDNIFKELKLHSCLGQIPITGLTLAEMNDRGKTHLEIAEYIRNNPKEVFKQ